MIYVTEVSVYFTEDFLLPRERKRKINTRKCHPIHFFLPPVPTQSHERNLVQQNKRMGISTETRWLPVPVPVPHRITFCHNVLVVRVRHDSFYFNCRLQSRWRISIEISIDLIAPSFHPGEWKMTVLPEIVRKPICHFDRRGATNFNLSSVTADLCAASSDRGTVVGGTADCFERKIFRIIFPKDSYCQCFCICSEVWTSCSNNTR